jgi:cation diffusion facilitator CzcD-associated flavoprotein CzcO
VSVQHFDVLVVGAGISGIGAGYHLQTNCPGRTYAILEGRPDIGGTWDLFRYPGVRSDSDMFTLGYSFRPWKEAKAIADGPSILQYLRDTARDYGIDRHMLFNHRVKSATWSSEESRWTVETEVGPEQRPVTYTCGFLYLCSGYFDYTRGHSPEFEGSKSFRGQVVHPQFWPKDLDYTDKRVVVIGSGATAVTLVPAMSDKAAHVTMLQRSPTYVTALPARDRIADVVRKLLPEHTAHGVVRWKNVLLGLWFFHMCRRAPGMARRMLRRGLVRELPPGYDIDKHFKPTYDPWDQRLCLVPDGDFFNAMKAGKVSVVTDQIERFTENGILLKSGQELPADVIVTATGLKLMACGGIRLSVDGTAVEPGRALTYKGMMLSGVPNCAMCVGYTNASWTLRADLASTYVCRLLNHMERHGYIQCLPSLNDPTVEPRPLLGLNSGYIRRGIDGFPKQGSKSPWRLPQNYIIDMLSLKYGAMDDGTMVYSKPAGTPVPDARPVLRTADA